MYKIIESYQRSIKAIIRAKTNKNIEERLSGFWFRLERDNRLSDSEKIKLYQELSKQLKNNK